MAAVDRHDAAGHVRAGIGGEQEQRAVEFRRLAQPALRDPPDQRLAGILSKNASFSSVLM